MQQEMVTLRQEVQSLRREMRGQRGKQRRSLMIAVIAVLIAAVSPVAAFAANPFNDLVGGSPHNGNIDLIYNAGITTGCVPNASYCPTDLVTRQEMASFLARTAGLGGNQPVTNARAVQGFSANSFSRVFSAGTGENAIALSTNYQDMVLVTIAVPGPGFVLVNSAAVFYGGIGSSSALVSARIVDPAGQVASFPLVSLIGTPSGHAFEASLSPVILFPVASSGNRTFILQVGRDSAAYGTTAASRGTITALYTPFGSQGAQGSDATMTLASLIDLPQERK